MLILFLRRLFFCLTFFALAFGSLNETLAAEPNALMVAQAETGQGYLTLGRIAADGRVVLLFVEPNNKITPAQVLNSAGEVKAAEDVEDSSILWVQIDEDGLAKPLQTAPDGSLIPAKADPDGRPLLPKLLPPGIKIFAAQLSVAGRLIPILISVDAGFPSVRVDGAGRITLTQVATPEITQPVTGQILLDNSGEGSTGLYKVTAGLTHDDLWGLGHTGTISATTSVTDPDASKLLFGSYTIPVDGLVPEASDYFSAYAYYYSSKYDNKTPEQPAAARFTLDGFSVSPSYKQNLFISLPKDGSSSVHSLTYSLTYDKAWSKDFGFGQEDQTSIIRFPFSVGYNFTHSGRSLGFLSLGIKYVRNLPFAGAGEGQDYRKDRENADPRFDRFAADLAHSFDFESGWSTSMVGFGQYTNQPMVTAETIPLGGLTSIRGLEDSKTLGDKGGVGQLELIAPKIKLTDAFSGRFFGFADVGWVKKNDPPAGDPSTESAVSFGVGLKVEGPKNSFFNISTGWLTAGSAVGRYRHDDGRLQIYANTGINF